MSHGPKDFERWHNGQDMIRKKKKQQRDAAVSWSRPHDLLGCDFFGVFTDLAYSSYGP